MATLLEFRRPQTQDERRLNIARALDALDRARKDAGYAMHQIDANAGHAFCIAIQAAYDAVHKLGVK